MSQVSVAPPRREEALAYIIECIAQFGISPTNGEIGDRLRVSPSRAQQLVDDLIGREIIGRKPGAPHRLYVRDVQHCRPMIEHRLRMEGWINTDPMDAPHPCSTEQIPPLPPLEHLPDEE